MSANRIISLGKDTAIYGLGGVIGKSLNIFLLPVLTRLFSLEAFGTIDLITLIVTFFNAVCILGMDSAIGVYYFEQANDKKRKQFASSFFWSVSGSSFIFALLGMVLAPQIANHILHDVTMVSVFQVACLTIPATVIFQAHITLSRFQFKPKRYNVLVILNVALNVLLAIVLVKYLSMHIVGIFWARVITGVLVIGLALAIEFKNIGLHFKVEQAKKLILYGVPLVPLAVITYASNAMGRYFLNFYWTDAEIGKYAFAVKLGVIAGVVFSAFNMAFMPYAAKLRFEDDFHETVNNTVKLFLFISGCLILTLYCFSNPLVRLFGTQQYFVCEPFIVLGMLILFLKATFNVFNIGVCYAKKTVYITISQSLALIANFLLNLFLVPRLDVLGAFLSFLVSLVLANLSIFFISQSVYPIRYDNQKLIELFMVTVGVGLVSFWVHNPLVKIAVLLTYIVWGLFVRKYLALPRIGELELKYQNIKNGHNA